MAGKTPIRLLIALASLAALGAAMLAAGALGSSSAPVPVVADDNFFDPKKLEIGQGQKVRWTNEGTEDHTVKFKGVKNKVFGPGESVSMKFNDTGSFKYHCTLHEGMTGKVIAGDV